MIDTETSKRITSLRFILMSLVVFLHNNKTLLPFADGTRTLSASDLFLYLPEFFISGFLSHAINSIFFLFSAYLLYKKDYKYSVMLKKKFSSLFIPFILWPFLIIFVRIAFKIILNTLLPRLVEDTSYIPYIYDWNIADWFHAFFGNNPLLCLTKSDNYFGGLVGQFWYLRDLMFLILLSPVLKWFINNCPFLTFSFVCLLYVLQIRPLIVRIDAFTFFMLGFYWAKYDVKLFEIIDKANFISVLFVSLTVFIISKTARWSCSGLWLVMPSLAVFLLLRLSKLLVSSPKIYEKLVFLAKYSFFVYALHYPLLLKNVQRAFKKILTAPYGTNFVSDFLDYFGVSFTVIAISVFVGMIVERICPALFSALIGGRIGRKKELSQTINKGTKK